MMILDTFPKLFDFHRYFIKNAIKKFRRVISDFKVKHYILNIKRQSKKSKNGTPKNFALTIEFHNA
jgi:hypothetical protein